MHSDVPGDDTPLCAYCEQQISFEYRAVAIKVGCSKIGMKSRVSYFHPEQFEDGQDEKWMHMYCMETAFERDALDMFHKVPHQYDRDWCLFCPEHVLDEPLYFEVELGKFMVGQDGTAWVPARDRQDRVARFYCCFDCMFTQLGEGNEETASYRIGMRPLRATG